MTPGNLEILGYEHTELGALCLRRRELLASPGTVVTEKPVVFVITDVLTNIHVVRRFPHMSGKTKQIQIRVSPAEKTAIERLAASAGMDVSTYVRTRALPAHRERFDGLVGRLAHADPAERSYVLAELNDLLTGLTSAELPEAVRGAEVGVLPPYERNYVAAMVEQACARKGVARPEWTLAVPPLERPRFVVELESLRPHLLRASPVAFKRRNIFIDATIGDRV